LKNGNVVIESSRTLGCESRGKILESYSGFKSIDGRERTTLDPTSVDFITAGQAFHWFNPADSKTEALRILKPNGWWHLFGTIVTSINSFSSGL
jgi:hypothetical protein